MTIQILSFAEARREITASKIPHPFGSFKADDVVLCRDEDGLAGWMTIQNENGDPNWLICDKLNANGNEQVFASMVDELIAEDPEYIAITLTPYNNDFASELTMRDFKKAEYFKSKDGQYTGRPDKKVMFVWSKEPDTYDGAKTPVLQDNL